MDSYYEADLPGVCGAMCTTCRAIKPTSEFKRWLTPAQARARGYSGNRRVQIDSSMCRDCQPKRKPLSELTIKEIYNRGADGIIHPLIAQDKIAQRKSALRLQRSKAVRKRWTQERDKVWDPIYTELVQEITRCAHQAKHIKTKRPAATQMLDFLTKTYLPALRTLRGHVDVTRYTLEKNPEFADWQSFASEETRIAVRNAWEAVPLDQRMVVRKHPGLVAWRAEMAQPAPLPLRRSNLDTSDVPAELPSERRARERYAQQWEQD